MGVWNIVGVIKDIKSIHNFIDRNTRFQYFLDWIKQNHYVTRGKCHQTIALNHLLCKYAYHLVNLLPKETYTHAHRKLQIFYGYKAPEDDRDSSNWYRHPSSPPTSLSIARYRRGIINWKTFFRLRHFYFRRPSFLANNFMPSM